MAAEKSAIIANRTAEMYVDDQLKNKLFAPDRASVWLEERLEDLQDEVRQADQVLAEFRSSNNIYAEDGPTLNQQELSDLNRELIVARAGLAETEAKLSLVRNLRAQGQSLDSISEVVNSPLIVRLREQETELLRQEAELGNLYGERHPRMLDLKNEIAQLATKIDSEVDRIIRTLNNDLSVATTRVSTIEEQLDSLKSVNAVDQSADVRLKELERQALASRELYETFLQRFKETREQVQIVQPDVRIFATASAPNFPSSPGKKLFAAGGFAVFFIVGCLFAIVFERLDRGIRSAKHVETRLGLMTMGLIPKLTKLKRKQKPYEYLMEKPLSAYAEAIRSVFMSIRLSKVDHEPKVILVTSSVPEEGKTTFSVSLGAMIAGSRKRVLLIDLDLRHPSVHRELGWQVSGGLVEFMAGERTLDEAIHHDLETGLHFLPIKGQTTNPTDLLDSQKMQELLDTCRENYDYIVLDTAPVASVTDTRIAARVADAVVFVVRWGTTVASAAEDCVQSLRDVGVEPTGVVLSQVDFKRHAQYGYADVGEYYSQSQKYYVN
ncbi:MAG: polysaccharide biosynthesis tyrosine autokinase [Planctomycetota bacterium]